MAKNVRQGNGNARRKLRAWLMAQGLPCAICGKPINYALPAGHCWAGPLESRQAAALSQDNVQATHRHCNREKSNKIPCDVSQGKIFRSRQW